MEVEVVLGQVGEDRGGEVDRVGPVELERVRGDLHRAGPIAASSISRNVALQVDRLRRRPLDLVLDAADHALDGAEQPGRAAVGLEQRAHQEGRRRLAVRPGDADDRERGRRVAVERAPRPGPSRRGREATWTSGTPRPSGRSTTSATAPLAIASDAKSWPSRVNPGTQKNSVPASPRRLS